MKRITPERLREILYYSVVTGKFYWAFTRNSRSIAGTRAGYENPKSSGGRSMGIYVEGQAYRASHLAWLYVTGTWPSNELIDHKDGNHLNQAWLNLRDTDRQINAQNRRKAHITNLSSGLLGVHADGNGKWRARIWIDGRNRSLGSFSDKDAAHAAYIRAKRQLHPGCTI